MVSEDGRALVFCLLTGRSPGSSEICKICFSSSIMPKNDYRNNGQDVCSKAPMSVNPKTIVFTIKPHIDAIRSLYIKARGLVMRKKA